MQSQTPSQALQQGRNLIRELAARHRTANPRVFGSVLTGRDRADSDLDVLVEPLPETTLFDLGGLQDALEEALGVRVDVKTPMDLPPHIRANVLRQAVPVTAATDALTFTEGMTEEDFLADLRTQRAVVMVGEAASRILSDRPGFAEAKAAIPWRGMRNRIAPGFSTSTCMSSGSRCRLSCPR
ncbi:nucleotidyltransferase domain-containing protein [Paenirhodobacter sp.]|uniref:nucleotidyltransferase domain-containing protein n=1 Tax=Paenirhodobacter sp. TaxID=1965326 RepID=UPI003B3EBA89